MTSRARDGQVARALQKATGARYQVCLTNVRAAIDHLISEGASFSRAAIDVGVRVAVGDTLGLTKQETQS